MGIIRKQSVLSTLYTYIGAAIGFVTTGILMPKVFSPEQIGILSIIVAYATILASFANLGTTNVITRFFPFFRNPETKNNGFLFLSLIVPTIGFIISFIVFLFIKPLLIGKAIENISLIQTYIFYVVPFIIAILYFNILEAYYKMLYNVTLGSFLKEVGQRIVILIAVLLFYFSLIDFSRFVLWYFIAFSLPVIILFAAIYFKNALTLKPNLSFIEKSLRKQMIDVGLFGIIGAFSGIVTINIDRIMIERILGLSDTGVYTIAFFFGTLVVLPSRALTKIASTFIAEAWKKNDTLQLSSIYQKSTITQLIIGMLIFLGIWCNIHNIFKILPHEYVAGKLVILFIGLAYLSDMFAGVSQTILTNSTYYRFQTYSMILLIALVIVTNFIFIPIYGIVGAAIAAFLSKMLVNLFRIVFIALKLKLFPYNVRHVFIIIIGLAAYLINMILPIFENYYYDIFYRSTLIIIIVLVPIYIFRLSEDINEFVNALWKRFIH